MKFYTTTELQGILLRKGIQKLKEIKCDAWDKWCWDDGERSYFDLYKRCCDLLEAPSFTSGYYYCPYVPTTSVGVSQY